MRQFILGFATLVLASSAHAGDQMKLQILGFSTDNKLVAIAETAVADGSGSGIANITVINVAKNAVMARSNGTDESEDGSGTEAKAMKLALKAINLQKYGITAGKNLGQTLIDRLPTDYSRTTNTIFSVDSWSEGGASAMVPKYELKLSTASANAECYDMGQALGMKLTLSNAAGDATPINKVLQQDSMNLPKSRGCALDYRIVKVVKSGSALLVAVKYSSPGFEGPNTSHIAVTADVNLK